MEWMNMWTRINANVLRLQAAYMTWLAKTVEQAKSYFSR